MAQVDETDHLGGNQFASFRETFAVQMHKLHARRTRTRVRDSRRNPDHAAPRWPFELIQNAPTSCARDGRNGITVDFALIDGVLLFEHDATPGNFGNRDETATPLWKANGRIPMRGRNTRA